MSRAITRYRVMAIVVGCVLLVLVLVAIPLRYAAGIPEVSRTVSPIHGALYIVYLAATLDVSRRARWDIKRTVLVMLAGTVPFLSFVVERRMTRELRGA